MLRGRKWKEVFFLAFNTWGRFQFEHIPQVHVLFYSQNVSLSLLTNCGLSLSAGSPGAKGNGQCRTASVPGCRRGPSSTVSRMVL